MEHQKLLQFILSTDAMNEHSDSPGRISLGFIEVM